MVKKKGIKEKLIEEENSEEETQKSLILVSSSDDEEGNEDLSLKVVEKARLREANKRKRDKSEGVDGVIDLSSSSCEEVVRDCDGGVVLTPSLVVEKIVKKKKKKKKKKMLVLGDDEEEGDRFVGVVSSEELTETITSVEGEPANVIETEELGDILKDASAVKNVETESVDNVVLRKLLRGPRYFDPPERNSRSCFNCGEEGHNAVNCTSKKRKKPCFICGSCDHEARKCTQGKDCFICNQRGHRAKDCPEKLQLNSRDSKICLRCGDFGHLMFSCSRDYDPDDLKDIQCYVCKTPGHLCCVNSLDPVPAEISCYNCGQSGHTGLGCAKQRGEVSGGVVATLCYKCGEEGHIARGCTNHSKPDRGKGEPSTPTGKYSKNGKGFHSAPPDLNKSHKKKNTQYEERDFANESRSKRRGSRFTDDPGEFSNRKGKNIEERDFTHEGKSKRRGRWIADDPGDLSDRRAMDNGWRSPATPTKIIHNNPTRSGGNHPSNNRSPWIPPHSPTPSNARSPWRPPHSQIPSSHGSAYPTHSMTPPTRGSPYPLYPMAPTSHSYTNPYQQGYTPSRFGNSNGSGGRRNYW